MDDAWQVPPPGERAGTALFVYGTLLFGEVVEALIRRRPPTSPAVLPGWRAARLPGRVYPGLVLAPGRRANGKLIHGLTPAEWAVFDDFEGDAYLLSQVEVAAAGPAGADGRDGAGPPPRRVLTYLWRDTTDVEPGDWDPDWFAATWLTRYVARHSTGE
ncbi:MAG: gamma-glutamylcyclotransferase [Frankia sp.]|nr:gamma-glutamylcyclotransferase [Frankia sp.]